MIAAVLLAATVSTTASEISTLRQAAATVRTVAPGVALARVAGATGNLEIEAVDATVFTLLDGSDVPVGMYLQGKGRFRFRAADRTAAESLRASNARNHWNLDLRDVTVAGEFGAALILSTRPTFEGLAAAGGEGETPDPPDLARFERLRAQVERLDVAWESRLVENRLDPTSGAFAIAWFDAPSPVGWTYDASRSMEETLFYPFGRPQSTLERRPIAAQPIDGGRSSRPAAFELRAQRIVLTQLGPNEGIAETQFELAGRRPGARIARFELVSLDSIAREWSGTVPAPLREIVAVESVRDGAGTPLPFMHSWSTLLVDLATAVRDGQALKLVVRTRRREPGGFIAPRGKGSGGTVVPGELVPTLDNGTPWRAIPIDVEAVIADPYRLAFGGILAPTDEVPGGRRFTSRAAVAPEELTLGLVRDVRERRGGSGAFPVTLFHAPGVAASHLDRTLRRAERWSGWLAERLGPMPDGRLDLDAVGNLGFTAGTVGLSSRALAAPDPCPVSESYEASELAASLAQRWISARAVPACRRERAFVVQLAEYLGEAAIDATDSPEGGSCLDRRRADWKMRISRCRWSGPIEADRSLYLAADEDCLVGSRAEYGLDLLRTKLGDDVFFGAIRRALEASNAAGRPIALDDVARESGAPALWDAVFRRFDATPVLVREGLGEGAANVGDPSPRTP